ncbi:MAG: hypothetical protein LM561_03000 [Desulfurococcaceae archaeon]|jgi:hypothetical protein|nr:hypothetical protein [Desulfurococcaceae archaeon]
MLALSKFLIGDDSLKIFEYDELFYGSYLPVDVIVITNGSPLGEDLVKQVWITAQKLFHEYGLEVYVIPYMSKESRVALIINNVEFVVSRKLTPEEIEDLILSACEGEGTTKDLALIGAVFYDENEFGNAQVI